MFILFITSIKAALDVYLNWALLHSRLHSHFKGRSHKKKEENSKTRNILMNNLINNAYNISVKAALGVFFLKLGFTPCKVTQPLQGMKFQDKEQKGKKILES